MDTDKHNGCIPRYGVSHGHNREGNGPHTLAWFLVKREKGLLSLNDRGQEEEKEKRNTHTEGYVIDGRCMETIWDGYSFTRWKVLLAVGSQ